MKVAELATRIRHPLAAVRSQIRPERSGEALARDGLTLSSAASGARPAKFLHARWSDVAMLNYEVPPEILQPLVPPGTELDTWHGKTYVSVVGYDSKDARLFGVPAPAYRDFPGVNLRFYVKREAPEGDRRGVVFISELVPHRLLAAIGQRLYHEPFEATPLRHGRDASGVHYSWKRGAADGGIEIVPEGEPRPMGPGSLEAFIAERYWGFRARSDGTTTEFRVEHPPWRYQPAMQASLKGHPAAGPALPPELSRELTRQPDVAFLVEGSPVDVRLGAPSS